MILIDITRDEADMLRENGRGKDVHMSNQKHKSRGKSYFVTTSFKTMKLLEKYRNDHIREVHDRR